jgi:hypothetical protein
MALENGGKNEMLVQIDMKENIIWIRNKDMVNLNGQVEIYIKVIISNDLRNGYGEMYWTDGSIYKGNWVNGIQHGYGKMIFIDGTMNEGIFDHNVYQGPLKQKENKQPFVKIESDSNPQCTLPELKRKPKDMSNIK